MRVRVERDVLFDAVAWAARAVPSRSAQPLLSGLLVESDDDGLLAVSGYDYETSARADVPADVEASGRVLLNGRLLNDIVRALPARPVLLDLVGTRVSVTCGRSSFSLPTMPVEDYPVLPALPAANGVVRGAALHSAVHQVAVAAGKDDTLPALTGVRVEIDGARVTLVATDRYRLAVRELDWYPNGDDLQVQVLVPARVLSDTAKTLAAAEDVVIALAAGGTGASERLMGFEGNGRRTTTRLLDGEFPKYRPLLPSRAETVAIVDTAMLTEAVRRVSLVADHGTPVRLALSGSEILLRAGSGDEAQAEEACECTMEGADSLEVAFNPGYLLDGLNAVDSASARISFTVPTKPAVISAVEDDDLRYRYLLMPVRMPT